MENWGIGFKKGGDANDPLEMMKSKYSTVIMSKFRYANLFREYMTVEQIKNAKSKTFPRMLVTDDVSEYTPGTPVKLDDTEQDELEIFVERKPMQYGLKIKEHDLDFTNLSVKPWAVNQIIEKLRRYYNRRSAIKIMQAAATPADWFSPGGMVVETSFAKDASNDKKIGEIQDGVSAIRESFVVKSIPDGSVLIVRPEMYTLLLRNGKLTSDEHSGGNGDFAKGIVKYFEGFPIIQAPDLPNINVDSSKDPNKNYQLDATGTLGIVVNKQAVGNLLMKDAKVNIWFDNDLQTWKMWAAIMAGWGTLRPECAAWIKNKAPVPTT